MTNRYLDTKPFQQFIAYAEKHPAACVSPLALLAGLMEAFTERIADVLERVGGDLDNISGSIFAQRGNGTPDSRNLRRMIERIGFNGELNSKSRESLVSIGRALMFVQQSAPDDRRPARPLPLDQPRRHLAVRPCELPRHEGHRSCWRRRSA